MASLALRTAGGSIDTVLTAFANAEIVRGYPMRGTVFAVAAADLRWLTELCAGSELRQSDRIWAARGMGARHLDASAAIAVEGRWRCARSQAGHSLFAALGEDLAQIFGLGHG